MSTINRLSALFLIFSMLTSPMALQAAEPVSNSKIQQDIKHLLQSENLSIRGVDILTQNVLLDVYEDHEFAPYWTNPVRIKELLELITNSADHGLVPADYSIARLHQTTRATRQP